MSRWRRASSARSCAVARHLPSGLRRQLPMPRQGAALDIVDPGAAQPAAGAFEPPFGDIAGDELAAVLHLGGERQCLAAGAGAEIDDPHPGPRIGDEGGDLRALVLDLDEPVLEGGGPGERRAVLEPEAE